MLAVLGKRGDKGGQGGGGKKKGIFKEENWLKREREIRVLSARRRSVQVFGENLE